MTENELLHLVLKGNREAIVFIQILARASQAMDDWVDEDKPLTMRQKHDLFWNLLVALPNNSFYQAHFHRLHPLITHTLNDWITANELEHAPASDDRLSISYIIRDSLAMIVNECCLLIGGPDWLREHSSAIRTFTHNEGLDNYINNLLAPKGDSA